MWKPGISRNVPTTTSSYTINWEFLYRKDHFKLSTFTITIYTERYVVGEIYLHNTCLGTQALSNYHTLSN